ncbi:MAG: type III secretion system chaperone [Chlamydiales bacterium]
MNFTTFLSQLADVLQFTALFPDKHGACLVVMKESHLPLLFEFDDRLVPNTILLSTPLSRLTAGHERKFFVESLKGNYLLEETLSMKSDDELFYLHRRLHPEIEAADLKLALDQFITTAKAWREKFEKLGQGEPTDGLLPPTNLKSFRFKV